MPLFQGPFRACITSTTVINRALLNVVQQYLFSLTLRREEEERPIEVRAGPMVNFSKLFLAWSIIEIHFPKVSNC